ncbi:ornithine cyclodeaminase family protein [Nocardia arthritidis]|uniref:Ornithine cyclodeaminase family protein n=1 Tax=Nocardia arthritidis TaxID=228602 RepID=A0A6G9YJG9_9NOCA|nr:ornithine cyclodeaminase family protein [Nocardia arthritidis]QIS13341.1 ornithine cyclodeaminase family protein [Nocardia arthritidis]
MLVLSGRDVEELLDLDRLVDAVAAAMADLSAGRVSMPDRIGAFVDAPRTGILDMPVYVPSTRSLASKLVSIFPGNSGTELPVRQAVIVAFDPANGAPAALMDATYLTAARTAACSALSAKLLARADATTLAVLGTGAQAREHIRAVARVRPIETIRVAGRNLAAAQALARELADEVGARITATDSWQDALRDADIACGTTYADEPVLRRAWIAPGAHLTSIGYNPRGREIDDETVAEAALFVEDRHAALTATPPNLDIAEPISRGIITAEDIAGTLGELVTGSVEGRTGDEQITLYKSVGVAVQDAAAATLVLAAAREQGRGQQVDL